MNANLLETALDAAESIAETGEALPDVRCVYRGREVAWVVFDRDGYLSDQLESVAEVREWLAAELESIRDDQRFSDDCRHEASLYL